MSFASINYARPCRLNKEVLCYIRWFYLHFKILCRLKEVLSYICWLLFVFQDNVSPRGSVLLQCWSFFISRIILKLEYSSCHTVCVQITSIWRYIFHPLTKHLDCHISLYNMISSFRKKRWHLCNLNFHLNVTLKNDP